MMIPTSTMDMIEGEHRDRQSAMSAELDQLMLRSAGAMAIAEGEEGWEKVPIDCPMLEAVAKLRRELERFSRHQTMTKTEATAVLMLLKSMTYEGLSGEKALQFQATLINLGERLDFVDDADEQFALWQAVGEPSWENTKSSRD